MYDLRCLTFRTSTGAAVSVPGLCRDGTGTWTGTGVVSAGTWVRGQRARKRTKIGRDIIGEDRGMAWQTHRHIPGVCAGMPVSGDVRCVAATKGLIRVPAGEEDV